MSFDERSPKRQRRSYSPPSPPETKPVFVAQHPHTPPPSVHMSPSWNAQTSSLQHGGSVAFPTPPSTAGYHGQMSGKGPTSEEGVESVGSTPVDSGNIGRKDGEGDVDMAAVDAKSGHRRTDHERQTEGSGPSEGAGAGGSGKLPGLFKLSTRPIARQQPHPSEDMLGLYGLRSIQTSVQRKDPVTGEKINKLRKSYEGKLKDLGLDGRNKATESQGELEGLVHPGWDDLVQEGLTRRQAEFGQFHPEGPLKDDLLASLSSALSLKPGRLPKKEHTEWQHRLNTDEAPAKPAPSVTANPQKTAASNFLSKTAPGVGLAKSAPASPRAIAGRERKNKKRRYDDTSFEGYEDGYSTGGIDDTAVKRQKRAVQPA